MMRNVFAQPNVVSDYELFPGLDKLALIAPEECTNMCVNPSCEIVIPDNLPYGWATDGNTLTRRTLDSWKGAACFYMTTRGLSFAGAILPNLNFVINKWYTASFRIKAVDYFGLWKSLSHPLSVYFANAAGTQLGTAVTVNCNDQWQYVTVSYYEVAGAVDRKLVINDPSAVNETCAYYFDCVQVEQNSHATTYCDGDQPGCIWTGVPHESKSFRSAQSRQGGQIISFESLGFKIVSIIGLDANPVQHRLQSLSNGNDVYQDSVITNRQFTLVGQMNGRTYYETRKKIATLINYLKSDLTNPQEPLVIYYDPQKADSSPIWISCLYKSGLEGGIDSLHGEKFAIQFQTMNRIVREKQQFATFNGDAATTGMGLTYVDKDGAVSKLNPLISGNAPYSCAFGSDGKLYVGGDFSAIGTATANINEGITRYNFETGLFESITSDTTSRNCKIVIKGPGSYILFGGAFTSVNGVAGTRLWAVYDTMTQAWVTGLTDLPVGATLVTDLAYIPPVPGGTFPCVVAATNNGVYINQSPFFGGSPWVLVGTPTGGVPTTVCVAENGAFYVAGTFTLMNGVANTVHIAKYGNGGVGSWTALNTGLSFSPAGFMRFANGILYFENNAIIRTWNGFVFADLFTLTGTVTHIFIRANGTLLVCGALSLNGLHANVIVWNGVTATILGNPDFNDSARTLYFVAEGPKGELVFCHHNTFTMSYTQSNLITNGGTIPSPVMFRFVGNNNGVLNLIRVIRNNTTKADITFKAFGVNYRDFVYLFIDGTEIKFTSVILGNLTPTIVPGSVPTRLLIPPGNSYLTLPNGLLANCDAVAVWDQAVWGIDQ